MVKVSGFKGHFRIFVSGSGYYYHEKRDFLNESFLPGEKRMLKTYGSFSVWKISIFCEVFFTIRNEVELYVSFCIIMHIFWTFKTQIFIHFYWKFLLFGLALKCAACTIPCYQRFLWIVSPETNEKTKALKNLYIIKAKYVRE